MSGLAVVALVLTSCAAKPTLPSDPLQKAAYCSGGASVWDRDNKFVETVLQFNLLGSLRNLEIDTPTYGKVSHQAGVYAREIADAKAAGPAMALCWTAYPQTDPDKVVVLPRDDLERAFGCHSFVDALGVSFDPLASPPRLGMAQYSETANAINAVTSGAVRAKRVTPEEATKTYERMRPVMLNLGNSHKVMEACRNAYL